MVRIDTLYQILCAFGAISFLSIAKSSKGAFTHNVKSGLSEDLGGILGGTQCQMGDCLILSGC
jgi:hypothetical protein